MDKDIRTKLEEACEKNYLMVRQEMVAMLSIEERATEFALKEIRCKSVEELECWGTEFTKEAFEEIRNDYIRIATEQEAIDAELLKRVHKGVLDKAIREKKEVAMKAYCKRCQDMGGGYPCSHKCYEYLEFEKTLEE